MMSALIEPNNEQHRNKGYKSKNRIDPGVTFYLLHTDKFNLVISQSSLQLKKNTNVCSGCSR